MKLYVDTSAKQVTVTREAAEKMEQNGRQKVERGTGRPMWSTQVFVLDDEGGEVITVTYRSIPIKRARSTRCCAIVDMVATFLSGT